MKAFIIRLVAVLSVIGVVDRRGVAVAAVPASPAADKPTATEGSPKETPVGEPHVYKTIDGRSLRLYVLNPPDWKSSDQRPAVVWFHGGGWEIGKGGPTQFNEQSRYLVTRGIVCIQVQYRLIQSNRKEAPLVSSRDAKSAMRWVRSHAKELGIDTNRIASGGGSAGGHLAAFVGMVEGTDETTDDLTVSCRPNAMLLYNPALLQPSESDDGADAERAKSPKDKALPTDQESLARLRHDYEAISPYLHVSRDDPPGIILVGDQDGVLPMKVLEAFRARCKEVGVRMDAVVYPGEGHSFFGISRSPDRFYDTTLEIDKFLAAIGWVQGPPTLTRQQVAAIAERVEHRPNKLERERSNPAKADSAKADPAKADPAPMQ